MKVRVLADWNNHTRGRGETPSDEEAQQREVQQGQFPGAGALRDSSLLAHCPLRSTPACPPASKRYRTHDGTCNNLKHPRWGSTMTPVQRFLPPSYSDDLQAPRRSVFGKPLPSAREISFVVHEDRNVESATITHLLMQWGQFIDHDITSSSQSRGFNGSVPRCCKNGGRDFMPKEFMHPECMPIEVPPSDPFYGRRGVRCLEFVRSSPAPRDDCALGWREQLNQVSAYIDGSPLYGSSARQSDRLRLFRNGMLQYGRGAGGGGRNELCRGGALSATCFKSGDGRVNEHPGLVAAHIVWVKQHNRIAQELSRLNPHWSDEKLYQETRRIIGAMLQHITYNEFLPIVLGTEVMRLFDLEPQRKGYYRGYDPKTDPNPASSFGSAAFRFGHSLVQPSMMRFDRFHRPIDNNVSLHEEPSNPSNIWSMGAVDRLLLGMVNQPVQKRDEFITEELTNHLFQTPQFDFGMDLAAINIQRGRDHGLPPYTAWREPCGLTSIKDFDDLFRIMPARAVRKLETLYRHVDDIDLFTGGMAERPVVGGMVGPTFSCIIAQQFSNLRKGDRFWYENGGFHSSFTPAQLQQIRRTTLAQILCHALDHIETIQEFAFLTPDKNNERITCRDGAMNNFNLSPWIEIDSETDFDNDINEFKQITKRPTVNDFLTTKPIEMDKPTRRDEISTQKSPPSLSLTKPQNIKHGNVSKTNDKDKTDNTKKATTTKDKHTTHIIDDKLDFRNKSRRYDDRPDRYYQTRPTDDYDYDDEAVAQQTVVVNNLPYRRPYRPVIAVTENIDKYTYLINYVPRPTQSWRQTTKKYHDRDVVKVTYQTYDDTYPRPNRPYYNKYHDRYNNNYKNRDSPDNDDSKNLNVSKDDSQKKDVFELNFNDKDNKEKNQHDDYYRSRNRPGNYYPTRNRPDVNYQTNTGPQSDGQLKAKLDKESQAKNKLDDNHHTIDHTENDYKFKNKPDIVLDNFYQITKEPDKHFQTENRPNDNYQSKTRLNENYQTKHRPDNKYQTENKPNNDHPTTIKSDNGYKIRDRLDDDYHNKQNVDYRTNDRLNKYNSQNRHDDSYQNKDKLDNEYRTNTKFNVDYHNNDKPNHDYSSKIILTNNEKNSNKNIDDTQNNNTLYKNYYEKDDLDQSFKTHYILDEKIQSKNKLNYDQTTTSDINTNDRHSNDYQSKKRLDSEYQTTDKTVGSLKLTTRLDVNPDNKMNQTITYVGTYKGHDPTKHDSVTDKANNKDNSKFSKDFSTYRPKTDDLEIINDDSISGKLSTFFHYESATRPYNVHRPTRRDDSDALLPSETSPSIKYYYNENVLHRYPDENMPEMNKGIQEKGYDDAQERSSIDKLSIVDEIESAKAASIKRPLINAPKTPSVAFQVMPSENSPSQWAVYEESDMPEMPYRAMPPAPSDPHELDELPRPMNLSSMRRRKPFRS
ncbi:Chorion peroxidase [Eumeta japonica]|uniref:Chorion peroxidase n=1 Tax=Eumeta variegata TaxID=151549 RepID=A0A4C1Y9Z7_EUMVA|nr:Chorion peroxidase [Eumeta japonica]